MLYTVENNLRVLATRQALVFPTGMLFQGENIVITYGEGDVRARLMTCPTKDLGFHPLDENYPTNLQFRILELPVLNDVAPPVVSTLIAGLV